MLESGEEKWLDLVKSQKSQSKKDNQKEQTEHISSYIFIFDSYEKASYM